MEYARGGYQVLGIDVDVDKVSAIKTGKSYIQDVPSELVSSLVQQGLLRAMDDFATVGEMDVVFICVPTPCTRSKQPDTAYISQAAHELSSRLRSGQLVVLRSTSYPGTTREIVRPALEASGLRVGEDVFLAFAPERVDPGRKSPSFREVPVLVGADDSESRELAALALSAVTDQVVPVSSTTVAEMAKLLENVFRNVNIALVNQLALLCDRMGIDVWEVIRAAATKPYGFMPFSPGMVGGHCIPVDPYYLAWKAKEYDFHMDFIEIAARINEDMPYYIAERVLLLLNGRFQGRVPRILVLGVTFKRDVADLRYSPATKLIELLLQRGVWVEYHDPFVDTLVVGTQRLTSTPLSVESVRSADCIIIATDHTHVDYQLVLDNGTLVFDVRNATHGMAGRAEVIRLGDGRSWRAISNVTGA
ncbi:UDP-N-acetyl-D-glucosamine dehydrogenase [Caldinitratiruptor microaerophilus]|uniref:UDP-N-acetyl-D-glucosamine dehydrogenase n=1 Tax=Caldinitratiruptor microaerophilus TaxID=671077 RepID=A0AA35CJD1_9FIRM|nr:UDP-N-acetyl-D-glucosamine dehydrogenase [Caldinitratiruptor microaerophilus]